MNTVVQKSLTAGVITALVLSTGVFDIVLGAFVRTDINGASTSQCGYGFGYDTSFGYGYGTVTCPPAGGSTNIPSGSKYVYIPVDTTGNTGSNTTPNNGGSNGGSNGSTTTPSKPSTNPNKPSTNKLSTSKPSNPYGSNYVNWDDNLSGKGGAGGNGSLDSGIGSNGTVGNDGLVNNNPLVVTKPTTPRRLPATGV